MVMTREDIRDALKDLPEGADITDVVEYLLYLQGIEEGLADDEAGRLISTEELVERIKTWRKVRWTERARATSKPSDYVAEDSEASATRLFMSLVSATDRLRDFPESGRIIPRFDKSGVREIIVRPYRIAYRLVGDEIRVQKVQHGARLLHASDIQE